MPEETGIPLATVAADARILRRGTGRIHLEIRQNVSYGLQIFVLLAGICVGLAIAVAILAAAGVGPGSLYAELAASVGSAESLSAVLSQSAPLIIVGLSATVAFRVRFWNIGIEGQMMFGAIAATFFSAHDIGPEFGRIWLMLIASALGGMAWMLAPALLKLRLGVNEIISTLLLNYVAFNAVLYLLYGPWKDPVTGFPNSAQFNPAERLAATGWYGLTWALPLALLLALWCWWFLSVSRRGFAIRFVHANPSMAQALGFPVAGMMVGAALLSGALAGIAGFAVTAGIEHRMTQSFFVGYGFSGILIAFIARNNPLGATLVAFFMAILFVVSQSLQVFYQIPGSIVQLIQAVIVITVAGSEFFLRHRLHWNR